VLHCNTRSLGKNISLLHDILQTIKTLPDIIAISETKINENTCANLNIPGYFFINTNSKTQAGGVGLYLSTELEFTRRRDLDTSSDGIESCWVELQHRKQKNLVIGCIYRHPKGNRELFHDNLKTQLEELNSKGQEILVLGDINENFMCYNDDKQTSEYLDMILGLGLMPIITKATRITDHTSSLIDHIYTNTPEKVIKSGICLADISDHLPVFCTMARTLPTSNEPTRYFRDFSHFNKNAFFQDLATVDFKSLITNDVNESMSLIVDNLRTVYDYHAPMRKASKQQRKRLQKPWISNAILVSIKRKQKLFKTHLLSKDPRKIKEYKAYSNRLNRIKELAKKNYLTKKFEMNKYNVKYTWKLIGTLISKKKSNSQSTITKLLRNNRFYSDKQSICDQLNTHFINVGHDLAEKLPSHNADPSIYMNRTFMNSFMFRGIFPHEVYDEIMNLKVDKSTIGIPRKCIKLAANHIHEALAIVFNQSLQQGIFPDHLKTSKVTPVDKGGDEMDPFNYRPISTVDYGSHLLYDQL